VWFAKVTWKGETGSDNKPTKMVTVQSEDEEYFKYSSSVDWTSPLLSPVDTYFGGSGR
jgi:hypothetical protein